MTKLFLFVILLVLLACRSSNKHIYFERKALERVSHLTTIEPVPPFHAPAYVLSTDDSIVVTNFYDLYQVYVANYKKQHPQFIGFLFDVLNHKIEVDTNDQPLRLLYDQKFRIDSTISSIYDKQTIKGLINRYVGSENGGYMLKDAELSLDQINTISYYFFINQYLRQDDCTIPSVHFYKLPFLLENIGEN